MNANLINKSQKLLRYQIYFDSQIAKESTCELGTMLHKLFFISVLLGHSLTTMRTEAT